MSFDTNNQPDCEDLTTFDMHFKTDLWRQIVSDSNGLKRRFGLLE